MYKKWNSNIYENTKFKEVIILDKTYCIYMHENKINGKKYIGQSCNVKRRWEGNGVHYASCRAFYNAILKYGWDNFNHIILEEGLSLENANAKEIEYIKQFNSTNPQFGYNISEGGKNMPRPFISEYLKKQWQDENYRKQKIESLSGPNSHFYGTNKSGANNPMFGKHHSEEAKKKISEKAKERFRNNPDANKGKNNGMSKRVICLTTGEIFETQRAAAQWAQVGYSTMSRWLRGETKTTGYHPETKEPLKWAYYKED